MKRALVLGGAGFVGRHVCEKLCAQGWQLTVPTRRTQAARAIQHLPHLTVEVADVMDGPTLARLLPGHDAVVHLIAVLHGDEARFERLHAQWPARLAQACGAAGVRRMVHVSALGAAPDAPSAYQRSKARGEQALASAGLALTVLRPSVIFGADDQFLNLFARLQALFPVMPLACADARFQPVWVEDVARAVLRCLLDDSTIGQTFQCAGPQVLTLRELVRLAGQASGNPRPVIGLPPALGRLQARLMELAPGEPLMSRDNLASMQVDNVAATGLPGLSELGIEPASVRLVAPTYLGHAGPRGNLDLLRRTAGRR